MEPSSTTDPSISEYRPTPAHGRAAGGKGRHGGLVGGRVRPPGSNRRTPAATSRGGGQGRRSIPACPRPTRIRTPAKYFHNNAWAAKGLRRWANLCERRRSPCTATAAVRKVRAGAGRRYAARHPQEVARRSGGLVVAAAGRAAAETRPPRAGIATSRPTPTIAIGRNCFPAASCRRRWPTELSRHVCRPGGSSAA